MILVRELTTLDSEIAQLIALIEAKRQQQEVLASAENLASEALKALNQAVSRIGEVAPSAIASLKSAVLTLFADGDGTDFNQPNDPTTDSDPTPRAHPLVSGDALEAEQPQNFTPGSIIVDEVDSLGIVIGTNNLGMSVDWLGLGSCPNSASGKGVWYRWEDDAIASLKPAAHDQVKLFSTEEFLQFQNWDSDQLDEYWDGKWVSDLGCQYRWGGATINRWIVVFAESCEWASPFASNLASLLWEDAPLTGQHCTITLSTTNDNENNSTKSGEDMPKPPSTEMVHLSANCGYLKLKADGRILAAYCWFSRKNIAESWMQQIEVIPTASVEMRESQRNSSWKWELKITGLSMPQIERLSKEELHQKPAKSKETPAIAAGISPPQGWGKPQVKEVSYQFGIGDIVDWNGCKLRVAAVGVESLHCVLPSDPDGTKPHTKVPISGCTLVEEGLDVGDRVEILSARYLGVKGEEVVVNAVLTTAELPIGVELPNGNTRYFPRNELKFIAYKPSQQQQQPTGLQTGTVLMGNRIVTTGNYAGLARRNSIHNARTGLQDKLAALELMKSGLTKEQALALVTGTESDDLDF